MTIQAKGLQVDPDQASWHKSLASGPNCDNCVEVAFITGGVAVRDSKDPGGLVHLFTDTEWTEFVIGVTNNEFTKPA